MTSAQLTDERIDVYMGRLDDALGKLRPSDREDILREIHTHIVESTSGASDRDAALDRVLRLLGTPEELASRYKAESLLTRASRSFSPLLILRTCWQWAKLGLKGMLAFILAVIGYSMALGFTVAIFLKPLSSRIGWWSGPEGFGIIIPNHPEQMHEWLGNYFVPVIAGVAFLTAVGTTQLLRWMMSKRKPGLVPTRETSAPWART